MTYWKYRWDELPADRPVGWGGSWWYVEFGPDGLPRRQAEAYDDGTTLRYGPGRRESRFGCLVGRTAEDLARLSVAARPVAAGEFEAVWLSGGPRATDP